MSMRHLKTQQIETQRDDRIGQSTVTATVVFDANVSLYSSVTSTAIAHANSTANTNSASQVPQVFSQRSESVGDRVCRWFIKPLKEMGEHDGFIILMILLP